jgi:hypothetical protein
MFEEASRDLIRNLNQAAPQANMRIQIEPALRLVELVSSQKRIARWMRAKRQVHHYVFALAGPAHHAARPGNRAD